MAEYLRKGDVPGAEAALAAATVEGLRHLVECCGFVVRTAPRVAGKLLADTSAAKQEASDA